MWEIIFILAMIIVGVVISEWDRKKNGRGESGGYSGRGQRSRKSKTHTFSDDDDPFQHVTRAQRRRDEEERKKQKRKNQEWYDDYETFTDHDGSEHSLDYDNYCDECDDYHEE